MTNTTSPTYHVSISSNSKLVELQNFPDIDNAIGFAMSLNKALLPDIDILVESETTTILSLCKRSLGIPSKLNE